MANDYKSPVQEQKCPSCGGTYSFDTESGCLKCVSCGNTVPVGSVGSTAVSGFNFKDYLNGVTVEDGAELPMYLCQSCGAELLTSDETVSLTCPYCENNIVLTDRVSMKMRPNGVIPFAFDAKSLPEKLTNFYKNKALLPRNFFNESRMGQVTGVYVPFWLFDGEISGEMTFSGERHNTYRQGDYTINDIYHYRLMRDASVNFVNLPVDASTRIDDDLMDSLEPFDFSGIKPFSTDYLAGFTADRFDTVGYDLADRAEKRMRTTAAREVTRRVTGYVNTQLVGDCLHADIKNVKYILLPVYLFDIDFEGKNYRFAVNGQTGKVIGEVPVGKAVSRMYFLKRAAIVFAALMIITIVRYFLGG